MNTPNNARSFKQYIIALHCRVSYIAVLQRFKNQENVNVRSYNFKL